MWIRSAFWLGQPKAGEEARFRELINRQAIPGFGALPGVLSAKALWPGRLEDSPPAICCQFLVEFAQREDIERMRSSPERAALGPLMRDIISLFDGKVSHIDYDVGEV